ncbi:DUF4225 domain-containing protein [Erwiniaceae bacterium BAC15a-03b]|uniref:DUF4225 domain-containing protein n=1 Tax=Winslowiella arboricola TaxID=2978220 RepID=A0A9J6PUR5_9GAMM|nr:DUF4225 domain-containing protein [Winslowiella arboricola]MCU5772140.1 DUF4225 domain-containing protein [Winslowiella arboricola]MCU5778524.1 DUF4225 domain-containing protein [Winslowiella arboricola]
MEIYFSGRERTRQYYAALAQSASYDLLETASIIVLNGSSTVIENMQKLMGDKEAEGFMKIAYIKTANYFGFSHSSGLIAYNAVDMATSFYGILSLSLRPEAWRLYNYVSSDYFRKINTMSKAALSLNIIGAGNTIRVISDLYNND